MIDSKPAYPTGGAGNDVIGADVYISNGRVMKDVQKGEVFCLNDFDKATRYIHREAGKAAFFARVLIDLPTCQA